MPSEVSTPRTSEVYEADGAKACVAHAQATGVATAPGKSRRSGCPTASPSPGNTPSLTARLAQGLPESAASFGCKLCKRCAFFIIFIRLSSRHLQAAGRPVSFNAHIGSYLGGGTGFGFFANPLIYSRKLPSPTSPIRSRPSQTAATATPLPQGRDAVRS
jgi:hypothetical protein